MEELYKKLNAIPDSYFGFVMGIISYAKRKPERLQRLLQFINDNNDLTPSDVVKYVIDQTDFHEFDLGLNEMVG